MKKVISLVCVLLIVLSILPANAQNNEADIEYTPEAEFLTKLGIITETDTIAAKIGTDKITRGEFAVLVYNALNGRIDYNGEVYFTDTDENSSAYIAANTLAQLGILKGTDNKSFESESEIYMYDAAAIMLRLMGYKNFKNLSNDLFVPEVCNKYDLLDNSYFKSNTSEKNAILKIFCGLLGENILEIDSINSQGKESTADYSKSKKTLLSVYFDIYKAEGILNSNGIVNITGAKAEQNEILVDDLSIKTDEKVGIAAGMKVNAYYKNENNPQLFAIYENEENSTKLIKVNGDVTFSDFKYTYEQDGKTHKITTSSAKTTFIYNNTLLTVSDIKYLVPEYGTITFIDNDNDGNYEIADIKSYLSFVVKRAAEEDDIFTVRGDTTGAILLDGDTEPYVIKNADGRIADTESITDGIVASCAVIEKNSKTYAKEIILSDKYITGTIDKTENDGDKVKSVTVSSVQYDIYPKNETLYSTLKPSNSAAKIYIDFLGNIIDIDYLSALGDVAAGYVVKIGENNKTLSKKAALYIYDELGRLREFLCADRVTIDGKSEKDNILSVLTSKNITDKVILFKVNKDDEVNYIDTAADYSPDLYVTAQDKLIKGASDNNENNGRGLFYSRKNKSFAGRVNVTDNTIIFNVPLNAQTAAQEDFSIVKTADLVSGGYYLVQGYLTNQDSNYSDIIVIKSTEKAIASKRMAVVTGINKAVDKSGEDVYSVDLYDNTGARTYLTKNAGLIEAALIDITSVDRTPHKIEVGDLVRYYADYTGTITRLIQTYDKSENVVRTGTKLTGTYGYGTRVFPAVAYSVNDGYLKIADASKTDLSAIGANDLESISTVRIQKIYRVSKSRNKIKVTEIKPEQIKTYKTNGNGYDKLILSIIDQGDTDIVIYEEES